MALWNLRTLPVLISEPRVFMSRVGQQVISFGSIRNTFRWSDTIDENVAPLLCGAKVFVEDSVVIDIPSLRDDECVWVIQTQKDRILVFTLISESFEDVQDYLTIHDGFGKDSPILQIENQKEYEASNKDLHPAIYTTSSVATLRSRGTRASVLQLKIQKAVECPFNLGANTACGRVVDETSCYCANFALDTVRGRRCGTVP
ncbi:Uncharacterized protein APZ42_016467 [Daphnia magna]|uniref:CUB domain-containing protein n=1 Tax=Daphnia magna TaxID=35525 RepID=A0A165AFH1_9CRUS|nr:Uncharacterized protein APZ42_016467 [Daphnia magna]